MEALAPASGFDDKYNWLVFFQLRFIPKNRILPTKDGELLWTRLTFHVLLLHPPEEWT